MAAPLLTVRALVTAGEREKHCQCADQAFSREPSPASARDWYQFVTTTPGYRPEQLRGAVRDGEQVGSICSRNAPCRWGRRGCSQVVSGRW
jgi:hypothetical protein